MISIFLFGLLAAGQAPAANPSPLTEDQLVRLRELVRTTQTKAERLRNALADRERQLAEKYAQFDLDAVGAQKLQGEIVDIQKQLLANYHALQVELRQIVGPERFALLKQRLDNVLRPKPKDAPKADGPPKRGDSPR
jgi:hypothetical protein